MIQKSGTPTAVNVSVDMFQNVRLDMNLATERAGQFIYI